MSSRKSTASSNRIGSSGNNITHTGTVSARNNKKQSFMGGSGLNAADIMDNSNK